MKLSNKLVNIIAHVKIKALPPAIDTRNVNRHIPKDVYRQWIELIRPGDIILTKQFGYVSNLFIGGNVTHAALYTGDSFDSLYKHAVIHAVSPNVTVDELNVVLTQVDYVQVWRNSLRLGKRELDIVCKRAKNTVNKITKYDYDFISDASNPEMLDDVYSNMYCSELVAFAYKPFTSQYLNFYVENKVNKLYYIPSTFLDKGIGFNVIHTERMDKICKTL